MASPTEDLNAALSDRYVVERALGEGGMATVYLARDLRHKRQVALKILKPELAAVIGAERFLSEIETTANLQHPNILPLYDSGEAGGFLYYVMPYVEGESLRDRLDEEKQLPVGEAVAIVTALARALDFAHGHGVVHRDIKPGNILFQAGQPVVADFGIALAVGAGGGARLTETGLSIGTPYYMSPEQATGDRQVGPRSDIYALGCVLYEMLVGDPPYVGSTAQAVLGQIITGEPVRVTARRPTVPEHVDGAIRRALEKVPADRFSTAADLASALGDPAFRYGGEHTGDAGASGAGLWRPLALAASAVAVMAIGLAAFRGGEAPPEPEWRRVQIVDATRFDATNTYADLGIAPDGNGMAFWREEEEALALRTRGRLEADIVAGTEGEDPVYPRFSPDGAWLAYVSFADSALKKVPVAGGVVQTLADSLRPFTGEPAWLGQGTLLFGAADGSLRRVSADGGVVDTLLGPEDVAGLVVGVSAVSERAAFLTVCPVPTCEKRDVWSYDAGTGEARLLQPGAMRAWYLPGTEDVVFGMPDGTIHAAPFDASALELRGPLVRVLDGVAADGPYLGAVLATGGTLLFMEGESGLGATGEFTPVWVDRTGTATTIDAEWRGLFTTPALSRDGRYLAIAGGAGEATDILVRELPDGPITRLTTDALWNRRPVWAPDGRTLVFQTTVRDSTGAIQNQFFRSRRADASQPIRTFLDRDESVHQVDWAPGGDDLVLRLGAINSGTVTADLWRMQLSADSAVTPLLTGDYNEFAPALSPDGHWLAFVSNESGRDEIVVRPYPNVADERTQVSIDGGGEPRWSPAGDELFYRSLEGDDPDVMMAARIETDGGFRVVERTKLFDWRFVSSTSHPTYDVNADASAFVMVTSVAIAGDAEGGGPPLHVMVRHFDVLVERALEGR